MTPTMRAAVLDAPGPVTNFHIRALPIPEPKPGWVRIRVKAFGLNRSELLTRQGLSGDAVTFPRVLGIEAVGIIDDDPSGTFAQGQQVVTMMGGMGRAYDGGYAEYTCVPLSQVIAFTSSLDWATLGAIPEMLQTAYGSLTTGLDASTGQSILIRGGTSSVGMATAILAKRLGMTVLSTTRNPAKPILSRTSGSITHSSTTGASPDRSDRSFRLEWMPLWNWSGLRPCTTRSVLSECMVSYASQDCSPANGS